MDTTTFQVMAGGPIQVTGTWVDDLKELVARYGRYAVIFAVVVVVFLVIFLILLLCLVFR